MQPDFLIEIKSGLIGRFDSRISFAVCFIFQKSSTKIGFDRKYTQSTQYDDVNPMPLSVRFLVINFKLWKYIQHFLSDFRGMASK